MTVDALIDKVLMFHEWLAEQPKKIDRAEVIAKHQKLVLTPLLPPKKRKCDEADEDDADEAGDE